MQLETLRLSCQTERHSPAGHWKYLSDNMATKSGGAVPVNQGGKRFASASGARANLGWGRSATKDVGTAAGNVMQVGAFGVRGPALQSSWRATEGSGFLSG